MRTLTIRLPDDKHGRLRELPKHRDLSVNTLIEELATISMAKTTQQIKITSNQPPDSLCALCVLLRPKPACLREPLFWTG